MPRSGRTLGFYALLATLAFLFVVPLVWMLSTSLKNDVQTYHVPPIWPPWPPRLTNYPEALRAQPFGLYFLNSMQYSATAIAGQVVSCSLAAYGFARLRWPGRVLLFALCVAVMLIPYQVTMAPLFIILRHLGWVNSYHRLIISAFFGSGYFIFLLRQFLLTVPQELTEAARIDWASGLGILLRIIAPLARPALVILPIVWLFFLAPRAFVEGVAISGLRG